MIVNNQDHGGNRFNEGPAQGHHGPQRGNMRNNPWKDHPPMGGNGNRDDFQYKRRRY